MTSTAVEPPREFRRGEGYLFFVGTLQILAASLMILLSLGGLVSVAMSDYALFNPSTVAGMTDGPWAALLAAFLSFQFSVGWIVGLAQLAAGLCCLKHRHPRLVAWASVLSLLNFPAGTLAAILMLHGLTQRDVVDAFEA